MSEQLRKARPILRWEPGFRHPKPSERQAESFISKIDVRGPDDCWVWKAGLYKKCGYGKYTYAGVTARAHRLSVEWLKGEAITGALQALHTCDNRPCCNPGHLYLGTHTKNMEDVAARGGQLGERNGASRLKREDVLRARFLRAEGLTYQAVADTLGMSLVHAWRLVNGQRWGHV